MKKYVSEFIGTFVLTFFGCGTAIVTQCSTENYPGYLLTALAFGLSIVAMAYSIGNVSGCHINPAVSFAMLLSKKLGIGDFVGYVVAQCAGGLVAGAALMAIFGKESGLGSNGLYNGNVALSIVIEIILTCVFLIAILGVTSKAEFGSVAGLVIGLTLAFVHILGIGLTGTSVNPARSLVAVFAGGDALASLWVFIVAPLIGAALAAGIYAFISSDN
ncbi:MAG: aquaporin [Blautia sp.]|nr:aquaporin [Blautia sp.]